MITCTIRIAFGRGTCSTIHNPQLSETHSPCTYTVYFYKRQQTRAFVSSVILFTVETTKSDFKMAYCHGALFSCSLATLRYLSISSCHLAKSSHVKPNPTPPSSLRSPKSVRAMGLTTRHSGREQSRHHECKKLLEYSTCTLLACKNQTRLPSTSRLLREAGGTVLA
jgi:hypothetical protein